jgi:tetratricopeptide (TPR) repeat protein
MSIVKNKQSTAHSAKRAFVEAMSSLGSHYGLNYDSGNREVIHLLYNEEANLLHARQIARANGWWSSIINSMFALDTLYGHSGRRAEWAVLVNEIVPDFVDPATNGPFEGREEQWGFVTDYRVRIAREARQWAEAERLMCAKVEWSRQRAKPALAAPSSKLNEAQRNVIQSLAASVNQLGQILRKQSNPECVKTYQEDYELSLQIDDKTGAAIAAFNLGRAYKDIPALHDLAQAERWYWHSLELHDKRDELGRGRCHEELGVVAYERFKEARDANKPKEELFKHINEAVKFYLQALDLLPPTAVEDLAVTHNALSVIYEEGASDLARALPHYHEAIAYFEKAGALYNAAIARRNVATALKQANRLVDARGGTRWQRCAIMRRSETALRKRLRRQRG